MAKLIWGLVFYGALEKNVSPWGRYNGSDLMEKASIWVRSHHVFFRTEGIERLVFCFSE